MAHARNWNAEVIAEFRLNDGRVHAPYDNPPPMLLLHTIGAKIQRQHIVPMRGLPDGDAFYVFASAHGSSRNPDWFHNIVTNPNFRIETGTETFPVHATILTGGERDAVFARWVERVPMIVDVQRKTDRVIPVIRLDRELT